MKNINGKIVDIINKEIFNGTISIEGDKIISITKSNEVYSNYIIPGFVDAHVHIESSMLTPSEFSRLSIQHGTLATISDPHEIANVSGLEGIEFMLKDAESTPLKIHFNAPSCVPATGFETSGAIIDSKTIKSLMNYPGVIFDDAEVLAKIEAAKLSGKPIDGHAPEVTGDNIRKYIHSGISTDHECASLDEALEKISLGMTIQIREGSAAKNFDQLHSLLSSHPEKCMLCTDDCHPDDLMKGHINKLVARAIRRGHDIFNVLRAASYNSIQHYKLDMGTLQVGDLADFIIVDDLIDFNVQTCFINGEIVFDNGRVLFEKSNLKPLNNFALTQHIKSESLVIKSEHNSFKIIKAFDGSLLTDYFIHSLPRRNDTICADPIMGINKIVVINRYIENPKPVIGFIQGFDITKGAIASTVAHDSHNIIAIGADDESITTVINKLIDTKGGLSFYDGEETLHLPLPVGGLMSNENYELVAEAYELITSKTREIGCGLTSPYMTMAFMALLVIPKLKIGDRGLFDVESFSMTSLEI
jgi:adenine deaminase